jgi:hypothetical protein
MIVTLFVLMLAMVSPDAKTPNYSVDIRVFSSYEECAIARDELLIELDGNWRVGDAKAACLPVQLMPNAKS